MSLCKICGKPVITAKTMHAACYEREAEKILGVFCDEYCRYPRECADEDELQDKHCDSCPLIKLVNLGL